MNDKIIELSNTEIHEHCILNIETGEKRYNHGKKQIPYFTGLYFKDKDTFFALYPTRTGPMMYYRGKEYSLRKDLHISLIKAGQSREFNIKEYNISIKYGASRHIDFDVWSNEKDVDLFYQIEQSYKNDEYYKRFTMERSEKMIVE